jgi:hypothetical protein
LGERVRVRGASSKLLPLTPALSPGGGEGVEELRYLLT